MFSITVQGHLSYEPSSYKLRCCSVSHLIDIGGVGDLSTETVVGLLKNL